MGHLSVTRILIYTRYMKKEPICLWLFNTFHRGILFNIVGLPLFLLGSCCLGIVDSSCALHVFSGTTSPFALSYGV